MPRSTKIVATLGPASSDPLVLERMLAAGVDVVRFNFSHGSADDHLRRATHVREAAARIGRDVAIMADLQGPKVRVGKFENGRVTFNAGAAFVLDANAERGNETRVGLDYKDLPKDVRAGDTLLLNDGLIVLDVDRVEGSEIHTTVRIGGVLSDNKGINKQGGGLSAPALTGKDVRDIETAMQCGADYVAVSFVKNRTDVEMARQLATIAGEKHGVKPQIIAKIERAEAIPLLKDILEASDGIMVARGDLAVEVGNAAVPALQKRMIKMALAANKLTITATQMMESMIVNAVPTRAEVSDVANAVLDGTDAVMLSAETAAGKYPVEVVEAMASIVESRPFESVELDLQFLNETFTRVDQSIAYGTLFTASHLRCAAIVRLRSRGRRLSGCRHDVDIPIYALTSADRDALPRVRLLRDVYPIEVKYVGTDREELLAEAEKVLVDNGVVNDGDIIVLTIGEPIGKSGGTNTMKIVKVGEHRKG